MFNKKIYFLFVLIILLFSMGACDENFTFKNIDCKIKSGKEITFFIAADPHHLSKKTYDNGESFNWFLSSGDGKLLNYTDEIIDAFTLEIEYRNPDILIIPGDLTCNGERESHLEMAEKLKTIKELDVQVFVVPGNHDIENPWARHYFKDEMIKIDSITDEEFVKIYEEFGYKSATSRDPHSLSYLATPCKDVWLLMLDSAKYKKNKVRNAPEMAGEISNKTFNWIKECANLAQENEAEIIAVMHHSLLDHNRVINENYTVENNEKLIELFLECNIEIVLTGHIHLQDIKSYSKDNKKVYDIATSSLIVYPNQYGILKYIPEKGFDYETRKVDVYAWVWEKDIEDRNLNNFNKYSKEFFMKRNYNKYYKKLLEISKFSNEEMKAISETLASLNLKYFSGFRNEYFDDITSTEEFQILLDTAPDFIIDYVLSMFDDERSNNNQIFIPIQ